MRKLAITAIIIFLLGFIGYQQLFPAYDSFLSRWFWSLNFGATSFPTSLDDFTNPSATDKTNSPTHAGQHSNKNDAVEAIEAKVGIDSSAVTTSHDYKLSGVTGSDLSCSLTGTEILTNKTLTSPIINTPTIATGTLGISTLATSTITGSTTIDTQGQSLLFSIGSDVTGDTYYRNASGALTRLGIGAANTFYQVSSGIPSWQSQRPAVPAGTITATTTASTSLEITVDGTDFVQVFAYGSASGDGTGGNSIMELTWGDGDVVVDQYDQLNPGTGSGYSFYLTYFGTPPATTTDITVAATDGTTSITDSTIVYYKY